MFRRQTIQESNFDSVMRPAATGVPAQLTIRLKIALLARDPSGPGEFNWGKGTATTTEYLSRPGEEPHTGKVRDGDGRLWDCRSWYEAEFNAFRIKFKRMVELAWNNQLILLPPDGSDPAASVSNDTFRDFVSGRSRSRSLWTRSRISFRCEQKRLSRMDGGVETCKNGWRWLPLLCAANYK
jgi:hypothetical protein